MKRNNLKILGLTGGIAAGKSAVSVFLSEKGGYILDADKISHAVILKGGTAYEEVLSAIEGNYLKDDGEIDRKKLGGIVFGDNDKLKILETIVHKHVEREIMSEIEKLRRDPGEYKFIVLDAPLLTESGTAGKCDEVWVVRADYGTRIARLIERNGLTKEQAADRIEIQTDWDSVRNGGYVFIENNGSIGELYGKADEKLAEFLSSE